MTAIGVALSLLWRSRLLSDIYVFGSRAANDCPLQFPLALNHYFAPVLRMLLLGSPLRSSAAEMLCQSEARRVLYTESRERMTESGIGSSV